jgi:hypothetical protein
MQAAQFAPAFGREVEAAVELLAHIDQQVAHDDVADLFELHAGAEQFLRAQRILLAHAGARCAPDRA